MSTVERARADGADLGTFRPAADRLATLSGEGIETPGPWNVQLAGWAWLASTSVRSTESDAAGQPRSLTVIGPSAGFAPAAQLGIGRRLAIGGALPMILAQGGEPTALLGGVAASSASIGDLALFAKAAVITADPTIGGFGLALTARVTLPTGDPGSFVSDGGVTAEGRVLARYDFFHTLQLGGALGYRAREKQHPLDDLVVGDTIPWGASLAVLPRAFGIDPNGHWTWMIEARGELSVKTNAGFAEGRLSPAFLGASTRYAFDRDLAVFTGLETALSDAIGAPRVRWVFGVSFAPTIADEDGDGVPDDIDECPGLPEDGKGDKPHDGCPSEAG
jgi:hypothetical protein